MSAWLAVDGNGVMRRLFHASGLRDGLAEKFKQKVRRWRESFGADRVFVAWDAKPTERQKLLPTYKAHRGPTPDAVVGGIAQSRRDDEWDNMQADGWEADDLLASIAQESPGDTQIIVVSDDKDMLAVLAHGVTVARPCEKMLVVTPAMFFEEWGFLPPLIPDYLAMAGDAVDGIPGVPGIGHFGAVLMLKLHHSLEGAIAWAQSEAAATSKDKRIGKLLAPRAEEARLYRRVATLNDRLLEGALTP